MAACWCSPRSSATSGSPSAWRACLEDPRAPERVQHTLAEMIRFRALLIHTAAYWLLHTLRGLAPKTSFWRAQFDTIRLALIKVAARITELKTRIKVALPSGYPHQTSWAMLAGRALKLPP